ncbi:site-specific integrase (plasmid) [Rhodococcus sp. ZPP]|nr:site-specific integrase [Rhodococcus sp. ZPP]MBO8150679.1 site-specific integrase [Rhodococcus erythropolis]QTJ70860.1 site-specific integrase [Rhodococcus sp. ZPP]
MGKRQRDCVDCGAPVGIIGRDRCCLCIRRIREHSARQPCPDCGRDRVLVPTTGRCVLCKRRCTECGHTVRSADARLCKTCRRRADLRARQNPCPRCGKPGYLRESTGWCGSCSREGPPKDPPRICMSCGELRRHQAHGLCSRCWQRHPDRPFVQGQTLAARLSETPSWLPDFVAHLAGRYYPGRACNAITALGRLLEDNEPNHPQTVLERSRQPGRSMGSLARALENYFTEHGLAMPTDQPERLAAGRRQRRIDAIPEPLRPAVASFADHLLHARERARRAGTRPRSDQTIEAALATMRDLANFLYSTRDKQDWSTIDVNDIEAFLSTLVRARKRRLTVLRQFFRFARSRRVLLIDPSSDLSARESQAFRGRTLTRAQQRALFRRWTTDPTVHPHEALVGMLALLHGASSRETRLLRCSAIASQHHTLRLGDRPHPVPLDPATWAVLARCLAHRDRLRTTNPHVIVTKGTKAGRAAASTAYLSHVLDDCGYAPRTIRSTRLVDLVNTLDPKLVAAAFGMDPQAALIYLADHVDPDRLPNP